MLTNTSSSSKKGNKVGKTKIQVAIITVLVALMFLSSLTMIVYSYFRNSSTYVHDAKRKMLKMSVFVIDETLSHLQPPSQIIRSTAMLVKKNKEGLLNNEQFTYVLLGFLRNNPGIAAFFNGDAQGNLLEVTRVNPGQTYYLNKDLPLPGSVKYMVRHIYRKEKVLPVEVRSYLNADGYLIDKEETPSEQIWYDPRKRPWYIGAHTKQRDYWTDVYLYENDDIGITVAHPILTSNGEAHAIVSADITIMQLAKMLEKLKVSENGTTFIINSKGHIISFPDSIKLVERSGSHLKFTHITQLGIPEISQAYSLFKKGEKEHFEFSLGSKEYLASFLKFPSTFENDWIIGVVVPTYDFVGAIIETNKEVLWISLVISLIAIFLMVFLSRKISKPIRLLAQDMNRIKNFQIDDSVQMRSFLLEISLIGDSLKAMKTSLKAFSRFVPKDLVRQLIKTGKGAELGGDKRDISIMFSDIVGFTSIAENLPSEKLLSQISEYLDSLTKIIISERGTVDKYIGDAIMALWGAPIKDPEHVLHACRTVLCCRDKVNQMNRQWQQEGKPALKTRIGLNCGEAVVGNMGSQERMNYTAIGDNVNLASRLEGINTLYGTDICVSEAVYKRAKAHFLFRPLDIVAVKGKKEGVKIYHLMAEIETTPERDLALAQEISYLTEQAFNVYLKKSWDDAIKLYQQLKNKAPDDSLADLYIERCQNFKINPPPKDWDGVLKLEKK